MLSYDLARRGEKPRYQYLYELIRDDIISGALAAGEKLPSKRGLAENLGVAVITVANAYAQLETEGYISSEERRGFFVSDLTDFRTRSRSGEYPDAIPAVPQTREQEYFVDFKANRIGLQHFPATIWNRYMREAMSLGSDSLLRTIPFNGLIELREAIARYLWQSRGMRISPTQVVIGAGTEYLYGRLIQMFGRDCVFAIEDPGYLKLEGIVRSFGNACRPVAIDENGLRADILEKSGADVVHVSPANHFPTGVVMPVTRRLELYEWANHMPISGAGQAGDEQRVAAKTGGAERYIIEDDYDSEFRYGDKSILPLFAQDAHDRVIYMNTFSKSLVPSLRISYMVLPPKLMKRYAESMGYFSCTVSSFEQYALARFIDEGHLERHINRMRNYFKAQRACMLDALHASPLNRISKVIEHNAGTHFILEVETRLTDDEVRDAGLAYDMALSLLPDYSFSYVDDPCTCSLIINYAGVGREQIPEVVARLCRIFC